MEKIHFEQSKFWLEGAKHVGSQCSECKEKYSVAIAMLVHAIIKANDALSVKFLATTARRHDEARRLFEDMIKKNVIKTEYASYKDIIQEAIIMKAGAEYRGSFFSKSDFEDFKRKAEKFLKMAGEYIK